MKFPDDLTDEQLVAWDRDVVPFLPTQPHRIELTHINDIDVHYVMHPEGSLALLAGGQQWTWLPGHTVSLLRQAHRESES